MRRPAIWGLWLVLVVPAWAGADIDRADVLKRVKTTWDAVETLQATGEEFIRAEPDGPNTHVREFSFKSASGGRRAMRLTARSRDGHRTSLIWFRQDGRRTYMLRPFEDDGVTLDMLQIRPQTDTAEELRTAMLSFLWIWMPRGTPLYRYVESGRNFATTREAEGHETFSFDADSDGIPIHFELDPAHDFLPSRLVVGDGQMERRTTRCQKAKGLWFPVEGEEVELNSNKVARRSGFIVKDLRVNDPIPDAEFGRPKVEDGVITFDDADGKGSVKGGVTARMELESKHGIESTPIGPPNEASQSPPASPWPAIVAAASAAALLTALVIRWKQSRDLG